MALAPGRIPLEKSGVWGNQGLDESSEENLDLRVTWEWKASEPLPTPPETRFP